MAYRIVILCAFALAASPGREAWAAGQLWDREGAAKAWVRAQEIRQDLLSRAAASPQEYLDCIRWFQKVYRLDPHYAQSDDAVFEAAVLHKHVGESFAEPDHLRKAAKLLKFLTDDYPTSQRAPEALLLLGNLYSGPLQDPAAARTAYDLLTSRFKRSAAAARFRGSGVERNPKEQAPSHANSQPGPEGLPARGDRSRPAPLPAVLNRVDHSTAPDFTRVTIETNGYVSYSIQRLQEPDRVFFDLEHVILPRHLLNAAVSIEDPRLKQIRMGQNQPSKARIVLDLQKNTDYSITELRDPFRIIVQVVPLRGIAAEAAAGTPQPRISSDPRRSVAVSPSTEIPGRLESPKPAEVSSRPPATAPSSAPPPRGASLSPVPAANPPSTASKPQAQADTLRSARGGLEVRADHAGPARSPEPVIQPKISRPTSLGSRTVTRSLGLKVGRIVIDPGHGGHDLGTVGPGGLVEKDLVLKLAMDLKSMLTEQLGAEVILTREDDSFITLEDRTTIANDNQADLFVSLHANYSPSRSTSGVETYFLDFARTKEEREVAARENAATMRTVGDLQGLVGQIARGEKLEESRELASMIQKNLFGAARQLLPSTRDRGVRSAPFIVLIGAEMPSILVEVAFLSNPADERALKLDENRQMVATALLNGIAAYMKTLGSETALNGNSPIR